MANIPTTDNNPGDLKDVGQTGATQAPGGFASFKNPQQGYGALLNQLQTDINKNPNWTLADFSNSYAPPSDNNDSAGYAAKLANQLGVAPNATISSLEPNIGKFADAVAKNEGYQGQTGSSIIPTAQASTGSSPSSSGGSLTDELLLGGGALGLTTLAALQLGADPLSDVAAGTADAGFLSSIGSGLGTAAEIKGGADTAGGLYNAFSGGGGSNNQPPNQSTSSSTPPPPSQPPSNETVSPESGGPNPSPQEPGVPQTPEQLEQQLPQAAQNSSIVGNAIDQSLGATVGGAKLKSDPNYAATRQEMEMDGLIPLQDEDGRNDSTTATQKAQGLLGDTADSIQTVLGAEAASPNAPTANLENVGQDAVANLAQKKTFTPIEQEEGVKYIQDLNDAYGKQADGNGNIKLDKLNLARMQTGHGKKWGVMDSSVKKEAYKSWSAAARKHIVNKTYHKDFYNRMMKKEQNLINSKKILKSLHGKKAPISHSFMKDLLKSGGAYAGIYLGDKLGGPLGAILGNMVGEKISRAVDKHHGRTIFETPGMRAALKKVKDKNPGVGATLEAEIAKANVNKQAQAKKREATLKLPAPKSIPLGARQGTTESVVVGGKRPPVNFEQAKRRKEGRSEGGLYAHFQRQQEAKKAAGIGVNR